MEITVSNEINGQIFGPLDISDEMSLQDFIALIESECSFNKSIHDLYHNMDILDLNDDQKTLKDIGLSKDDLLLIRNKVNVESAVPVTDLTDDEFIEEFRNEVIRNPILKSQLVSQLPQLETLLNDSVRFKEVLGPVILQRRYSGSTPQNPFGIPQQEYTRLMSNPDDPENQKRITELIDQQEIDEQMRNALEYTPEVFTSVHMLFINLEINGTPVKAFVDTGAQMTILSSRLAEKTGLSRLVDKRFIGEAHGVGVGKILGRIHQAQIKIETQFIPCSFTVLDTPMDLLIGLDMLKRHQACVDLKRDVLMIAGVETKFLSESEIPKDFGTSNGVQFKSADEANKSPAKDSNPVSTTSGKISKPNTNKATVANPNVSQSQPQAAKTFPESTIKKLMDLGFSRAEVIKALTQTGGNAEFAASLLFQ
ncbi:hypothetical protein Kpol_526p23 [Vanderwaltozyma polyspora DSM 70294]|uniref:DNA damage-inducible protein 1 n=1 Tax=Vanderwaltozyma polyspora (strain ATCC 22028 / DSM 70294 / BCRC 21397 / CBS 2163 / NBRC 10782 / NRRL Y-8283 / UCD 57-17) TaxID=436907 RepID=A7TLS8_VANPO|nr:uncharacterized protein Kpol_526p23 [Vanderwaltozyma polyspora DSM 70294]EDO16770.1 hypothetical protein Kpol_526p23 [Vanderwaltozyma polyspora DSM 70294]